jgi:CRP-like cAMP-binding protein
MRDPVTGAARRCSGATDVHETDVDEMEGRRARSFWRSVEPIASGASLQGDDGRWRLIVVVSGWIAETRIPPGRRQIVSFLVPGDVAVVGSQPDVGCRGLVALTQVEIADAASLADGELSETMSRSLLEAVRRREDRLSDESVRIGRLTAEARMLDLLLELHDRLAAVGLARDGAFRIPLTQETFADALGLSVADINRTVRLLQREGLVTFGRGTVTLHEPDKVFAATRDPSPATPSQSGRTACYR